jgi:hypothetical protein
MDWGKQQERHRRSDKTPYPAPKYRKWALCRIPAALALIFFLTTSANAQRVVTGKEMVQPCTHALLPGGEDTSEWMQMGFCVGVILAIAQTATLDFCVPPEATRQEQLATVVRYLESDAERLGEDFFQLVIQALLQTWPCAKPPPGIPGVAAGQSGVFAQEAPIPENSQASNPGNGEMSGYPRERAALPVEPATAALKGIKQTTAGGKSRRASGGMRKKPRQQTAWSPFEMFFFFGALPKGWQP